MVSLRRSSRPRFWARPFCLLIERAKTCGLVSIPLPFLLSSSVKFTKTLKNRKNKKICSVWKGCLRFYLYYGVFLIFKSACLFLCNVWRKGQDFDTKMPLWYSILEKLFFFFPFSKGACFLTQGNIWEWFSRETWLLQCCFHKKAV